MKTTKIETLKWTNDQLVLLDQTRLPEQEAYLGIQSLEELIVAIQSLCVRGAPAIGISAAYGMVLAARSITSIQPKTPYMDRLRHLAVGSQLQGPVDALWIHHHGGASQLVGRETRKLVGRHLIAGRKRHHPALCRRVPNNLWISKVAVDGRCKHWIRGILAPRATVVGAKSEALNLRVTMMREDCDELTAVVNDATGENKAKLVRRQCNRQVVPVKEIARDGVAPMHWTPRRAAWEMLIEEVVLAGVIDEAVRVVHPAGRRREVV